MKLLVLDEPTATLPDNEVQHLLEIVRQVAASGVGVLYVTHRLDEVFLVANRVTVLRDGHKAATEPIGALDRRSLISLLIGTEFEDIHAAMEHMHTEEGERVLEVTDLRAGPIDDVSLEIKPGDVVGIAGITGSGRESILGIHLRRQPPGGWARKSRRQHAQTLTPRPVDARRDGVSTP